MACAATSARRSVSARMSGARISTGTCFAAWQMIGTPWRPRCLAITIRCRHIAWQKTSGWPDSFTVRTSIPASCRRFVAKTASARLPLRGLLPDANYAITNRDQPGTVEKTGRELAEEGLGVVIPPSPRCGHHQLPTHEIKSPASGWTLHGDGSVPQRPSPARDVATTLRITARTRDNTPIKGGVMPRIIAGSPISRGVPRMISW